MQLKSVKFIPSWLHFLWDYLPLDVKNTNFIRNKLWFSTKASFLTVFVECGKILASMVKKSKGVKIR